MALALDISGDTPSPFDYASLDLPTSRALKTSATRLSELSKNTALNLWQMGEILALAQDKLASRGNGTFVRWLESEANMKYRTAYRLIWIYQTFDFDKLSKTKFSTSALYVLSVPSTPTAAREEALRHAERGETITHATAQAIVRRHKPPPPMPPSPPVPPLPPLPPSPEYVDFERDTLLPRLHDAGIPDAPQMLSGIQEDPLPVPEAQRARAESSLRESIVEAMRGVDTGDEKALNACADEVLSIIGRTNGSIAVAARFGAELAKGPRTLSDLTELAIWACGECTDGMERDVRLRWRKRALRILDAATFCGGLVLYEHELASGQLVYALNPRESGA